MGKAIIPHNAKRPLPAGIKKALDNKDIEGVISKLTLRMRHFAEEYIIDFKGGAAAVRAGYSPRNADQQAYTLMNHAGILAYIEHLSKSKANKIMSVSPDYVLSEVTRIISAIGTKDGDKLRGLELLARHLGMFVDRTEITGKDGGPIAHQETLDAANDFTSRITRLSTRTGESTRDQSTTH